MIIFLPPASEVCEGYVFTGVCLSTGGVVSVSVWGVSVKRGVSGPEGVSVRERPPADRDSPYGNERAVHILPGCILFIMKNLGEWITVQASWFWIYSPGLVSDIKISVKKTELPWWKAILPRNDEWNEVFVSKCEITATGGVTKGWIAYLLLLRKIWMIQSLVSKCVIRDPSECG